MVSYAQLVPSKKDITRVFNAETFIIGLIDWWCIRHINYTCIECSISVVVENMTGVAHIAKLHVNESYIVDFH